MIDMGTGIPSRYAGNGTTGMGPTAASHKHRGSPTDKEMGDSTQRHHKKTQNILELSDEDEDDNPVPPSKKSKGRKQSNKKSTVIDSSSDEQVSKK